MHHKQEKIQKMAEKTINIFFNFSLLFLNEEKKSFFFSSFLACCILENDNNLKIHFERVLMAVGLRGNEGLLGFGEIEREEVVKSLN